MPTSKPVTTFADLNLDANLARAIAEAGYTTPTPVQAHSIPEILNGHDIVASAQTGTGKTAAFVLPALHALSLSKASHKPRVLILTPTRELASQITTAAKKYGKYMRFNIISLLGGMPYRQQLKELSGPVDIIVATPGRLLDHLDNGRLDLSEITMLILDEADRMLDMGFIDDVNEIAKVTPATRQTLLFSATVDKKLATVIRHLLKNPVTVDLSNEIMAPKLIEQKVYLADNTDHKNRLLLHFLENDNIFKGIIFSATKLNADYLTQQLCNKGFEAAALHGDLKQNQRNKTVEQFRRGKFQFLIATDVAARGIDINDITHVINYDLPKFSEDYVHRIGRTGRAGKSGVAISLASPTDARHLQKIERYIGQKLEFSMVEGMEPTKRMKSDSAPAGKGGKYGKSSAGGRGGYKGKSEPRGSYARSGDAPRRSSDSSSRGGFDRRDDNRRSETKSRFERSDDTRSPSPSRFARSDSPARSGGFGGGRSERSDDRGNAPSRFARTDSPARSGGFGGGRSDRSDDRGNAPSRFARSDSPARSGGFGGGRSDRSDDRGNAPSRFARSDSPARSGGFGGGRSERSDDSRGNAPSRFARSDSPARSGGFGGGRSDRSSDSRSPSRFAKTDGAFGGRSAGRSDDSRGNPTSRFAKPDRARDGEFKGRPSSKSSAPQSRFAKSDDRDSKSRFSKDAGSRSADSRISYAKAGESRGNPRTGFGGKPRSAKPADERSRDR